MPILDACFVRVLSVVLSAVEMQLVCVQVSSNSSEEEPTSRYACLCYWYFCLCLRLKQVQRSEENAFPLVRLRCRVKLTGRVSNPQVTFVGGCLQNLATLRTLHSRKRYMRPVGLEPTIFDSGGRRVNPFLHGHFVMAVTISVVFNKKY